jgi:hypothetical protein
MYLINDRCTKVIWGHYLQYQFPFLDLEELKVEDIWSMFLEEVRGNGFKRYSFIIG